MSYDYEAEIAEKEREIEEWERNLAACQREIRRLHSVCREHQEMIRRLPLQNLLQIFDGHGWKGSYSVGGWSIVGGGYDLWFQVYRDGIPKVECVDGEVAACNTADADTELAIRCILEAFGHLRRAKEQDPLCDSTME